MVCSSLTHLKMEFKNSGCVSLTLYQHGSRSVKNLVCVLCVCQPVCYVVMLLFFEKAVKEYFRRRANSEKEPVIPEYQELELGSDDKVSLQVETMSGPGWVLSVTKKEVNSVYTMYIMCVCIKYAVNL